MPKIGRGFCLGSTALAVLLIASSAEADAARAIRLERIVVTVADLARTEHFFRDALDFETVARGKLDGDGFAHLVGLEGASAETLTMRLGNDRVTFVRYTHPGRPYPADSRSPDLWFQHFAIVVSDMDKAYKHLKPFHVQAISSGGPVQLPPENGLVRAFKFRDPDGHPLELLYFPPGQGRAVWQEGRGPFLGIDHSAIGVSDTPRSREFYGHLLGLSVAYAVTNRGPTQEALDGTFGAVVEITGLRPASTDGPGVEFLDYRTPPTGRAAPIGTAANDIVHVELDFAVDDLTKLVGELRDARASFVSPDEVELGDGRRAAVVRDPDGHALLLEQEVPH